MTTLKMFVLSGAALVLWLAPLSALDKRIGWHKSMQGLSLCAAVACAVSAGNIARRLADENEIEELKTWAIKADVADEIATEVYVSQAQRQQEAEQILTANSQQETENSTEVDSIRESLELLVRKTYNDYSERATVNLSTRQREQIELILQCHIKGITGKNKILKEVWGVSAGSSQAYRDAKAEYDFLIPFVTGENDEQ